MRRLTTAIRTFHNDERGHAQPAMLSVLAAIGAVVLGVGAAGDTDWVPIVGGVILGIGIVGSGVAAHMTIDYELYARIETIEKK